MKFLFCFLFSIFILLQYTIWFSRDGLNQLHINKKKVLQLQSEQVKLQEKHSRIIQEINNLHNDEEEILEIAREKLGYIKNGEVFYTIQKNK